MNKTGIKIFSILFFYNKMKIILLSKNLILNKIKLIIDYKKGTKINLIQ